MADDRLRKVIEAYGADSSRWPSEVGRAGPAALEGVDSAVLVEARCLDMLLAKAKPGPDPIAEKRILAALSRLPAQPRPAWEQAGFWHAKPGQSLGAGLWTRLAGLVAASLLGVVLGLSDIVAPGGLDEEPDFAALVLDETPMAGLE